MKVIKMPYQAWDFKCWALEEKVSASSLKTKHLSLTNIQTDLYLMLIEKTQGGKWKLSRRYNAELEDSRNQLSHLSSTPVKTKKIIVVTP